MKHFVAVVFASAWSACTIFAQTTDLPLSAKEPTLLETLNRPETGDSYPYLSSDGLRLYFTQGVEMDENRLYVASRPSVDQPFGKKQPVDSSLPDGAFSAWFSTDEKEIYFIQNRRLYYASRSALGAGFGPVLPVTLTGVDEGFISGPSLTPDKQELYLYYNNGKQGIYRLKKTGEHAYTVENSLDIGVPGKVGPGQLSKNGLAYYLEMETSDGVEKIYRITRKSLTAPWEKATEIEGLDITPGWGRMQPSVNGDGTLLAYVLNGSNRWQDNELATAALPKRDDEQALAASDLSPLISIQAYPNPTDGRLTLALEEPVADSHFLLRDGQGRELLRQPVRDRYTTLDLSAYPAGVYFVELRQKNAVGSVKVVKQ